MLAKAGKAPDLKDLEGDSPGDTVSQAPKKAAYDTEPQAGPSQTMNDAIQSRDKARIFLDGLLDTEGFNTTGRVTPSILALWSTGSKKWNDVKQKDPEEVSFDIPSPFDLFESLSLA